MKKLILTLTAIVSLACSTAVMAKTETIQLKGDIYLSGEEAIVFPTRKGEVYFNAYAMSDQVSAQALKYRDKRCLVIQSKQGIYHPDEDGSGIQKIQTCPKQSKSAQ
ncbi:TPA: hypothetical protein OXK62_003811 [Acinetobacter baumannii]|nr:hypothetical protein [Acinetobacter baumannii]HCW3749248.1 hypothetical protein [Acinetobacter baumannii]